MSFQAIKKVRLIGLGSMGSFFAPKLYKTEDVDFALIADGERKERLRTKGVTINGEHFLFPVETPAEAAAADLVIIAVKSMALPQALSDIRGCVGPGTQILCVLNGVDSEEKTAAVYGWEHVLYSFMRISIDMTDGAADYPENGGFVHFGEADNNVRSDRVLAVAELFDRCGIPYKINRDMIRGMWFKYLCNVGENMTSALLGLTFLDYEGNEYANMIRHEAEWEVIRVAEKKVIRLSQEDIEKQDAILLKQRPGARPSTLRDLEKGKKTEADLFSGTLCRMAEELGVDAPVNRMLYWGVRAREYQLGIR